MSYIEYIILKEFLCVSRKKKCLGFFFVFFSKNDHSGVYSILENVALHKNAWQLHPYENTYYKVFLNASNAVGGLKTNLSFYGGQCTQSGNGQYEAMWRVDLGAVLGINHITLYYKTENILWGKYIYLYNSSLYFFLPLSLSLSLSQ